jgi:hypothetical protein
MKNCYFLWESQNERGKCHGACLLNNFHKFLTLLAKIPVINYSRMLASECEWNEERSHCMFLEYFRLSIVHLQQTARKYKWIVCFAMRIYILIHFLIFMCNCFYHRSFSRSRIHHLCKMLYVVEVSVWMNMNTQPADRSKGIEK